ncbi:hypothetical protein LZK73_20715 [Neorhizobium galegae]|nr:hypothetical protein LZK73_20715 [Neorhizobium galegae]
MNGADMLCDVLLVNGVDVCFANPGTSEMHFVAALDRKPAMRCILGLSEGVVTGAADGYARMADKPAATLLHLGPGLANGLANLHNARRARTPMLNVVGDHASYHLQYDAPLTSDIESLARPMSHWVGRASGPADIRRCTEEGYVAALANRGVSTMILPADAAWGEVSPETLTPAAILAPPAVDPETLKAAVAALRGGKRAVIMLAGAALRENLPKSPVASQPSPARCFFHVLGSQRPRRRAGACQTGALQDRSCPRSAAGFRGRHLHRRATPGHLLCLSREAEHDPVAFLRGHPAGGARTRSRRRAGDARRCTRDQAGFGLRPQPVHPE